jgi:hypothetical protein
MKFAPSSHVWSVSQGLPPIATAHQSTCRCLCACVHRLVGEAACVYLRELQSCPRSPVEAADLSPDCLELPLTAYGIRVGRCRLSYQPMNTLSRSVPVLVSGRVSFQQAIERSPPTDADPTELARTMLKSEDPGRPALASRDGVPSLPGRRPRDARRVQGGGAPPKAQHPIRSGTGMRASDYR